MKQEIIDHLIEQQEQVIADIEASINQRNEAADLDEEDTREGDDFAQQEMNKDFVRRIQEQLEIAKGELTELKQIKFDKNDSIQTGALVETKDMYIIVGPSVMNSNYNNKKVLCLSNQAPAYSANEGKTAKDKLTLGTKEVEIVAIY